MRIVIILALCVWSCQAARDGPEAVEQQPGLGRNCSNPELADGFIVPDLDSYEDNSTAYYGCKEGKKPALKTWWGEIKCENRTWSHLPECIDASSCITPHVPNAEPQDLRSHYATEEKVNFRCKTAYSLKNNNPTALCENGQWDLPVCERHQRACDPPARVDNAMVKQELKELYADGERLEFVCKPGYELKGTKTSTCRQKSWTRLPECVLIEEEEEEEEEEEKPTLPRQSESGNRQASGGSGSAGGAGHKPTTGGSGSAGGAGYRPSAGGSGSAGGHKPIPGGSGSAGGAGYRPSAGGSGFAGVSACGELPQVPHGTLSEQANSMALVVQCPLFYKLFGPNKVYCDKGTWTELPVCKPPCVLDEKRFYFYYQNDKYLEEGTRKDYLCKTNYAWTVVSCVDGRFYSNPTCRNP